VNDVQFAVVGKGLFGSAAARHLATFSESVAVIGPDEPADRRAHDGVYASHYDQGRLTRRADRNRLWSEMTERTFTAMTELEELTDRTIHRPVGSLTVHAAGVIPRHAREWFVDESRAPVDVTHWDADDETWRDRFSIFSFPGGSVAYYEGAPAGVLDPRQLVAANLEAVAGAGGQVVTEIVETIVETPDGVEIRRRDGLSITSDQVLVATGSFTNFFDLLARPVPTSVESETIVLATVPDEIGEQLASAPVVSFMIDDPHIADIYMTPPLVYPDGRWKVKMGANTSVDHFPMSVSDSHRWFREGPESIDEFADVAAAMISAVKSMWRGVEFIEFEFEPCIITMTANDHPIIDRISERTCVAVAGNGSGAKSSVGWGQLGADLLARRAWPDWIDRSVLSAG
jgi:sarcosine oxidase